MDLWFNETFNGNFRYGYRTKQVLFSKRSPFQLVEVLDTEAFGRVMTIDGLVMVTDFDEFVYHEMISHIPICLHPDPKRVLVIGAGDGGTIRELLKHECIEKITVCEIDELVVQAAKEFFPKLAAGFSDPRVELRIGDGIKYVQEQPDVSYDVVLVDSTDPIGPGEGLFSKDFYQHVARLVGTDGLMVCQSESPWHDVQMLGRIRRNVHGGFSNVQTYWGIIPSYPIGSWSWTMGSSSKVDPATYSRERFAKVSDSLSYLTEDLMVSSFHLPKFFARKLVES